MAEFIVAIELGSSKVTGIAGKKNLDGSVSVLAAVREDARSFIRKGVVYNIDKTAQCLTSIVSKLSNQLKTEITQVYVGMGGQSIRSVKNTIVNALTEHTKVTAEMVNQLMDQNFGMKYADKEILDVAEQEYKVDQQLQADPVGIECTHLEGNFLNIISRSAFFHNINSCFEGAKINVVETYISPMALAGGVLTETERRSGCALVDLGASTTTVSVYYKNILRHIAVIPLGSNNITMDLTTLSMEEDEAERMKLKYASAYTESEEIDSTQKLSVSPTHQIETRKFIEVVEGRMLEIVENVWSQINKSGYQDRLLGGIVLTGGGSNMNNIEKAFLLKPHSNMKIRIARTVTFPVDSKVDFIKAQDATSCTILSLLYKGKANCAGEKIGDSLFDAPRPVQAPATPTSPTKGTMGQGSIAMDKKKQIEEEEARRKEEEEQKRLEEEEQKRLEDEKKRIAEEKRRNSIPNRFMRGMKDVFDKLTSGEE